jgi:hypothetical protein
MRDSPLILPKKPPLDTAVPEDPSIRLLLGGFGIPPSAMGRNEIHRSTVFIMMEYLKAERNVDIEF